MRSRQPLSQQLRDILNIIEDLSHNNTNASIKDIGVIEEARNLPEDEVRNYLDQLESLGLIIQEIRVSGADFRHLRITTEGINELQNQDIK
jgi:hypothetical protein